MDEELTFGILIQNQRKYATAHANGFKTMDYEFH